MRPLLRAHFALIPYRRVSEFRMGYFSSKIYNYGFESLKMAIILDLNPVIYYF